MADAPHSQFNSTNRGYLHANSYPALGKRVDQFVISITSDRTARARPLPDVINSLFREYMFDGKVSQKKKNAIYDGKNSVVWTREYDEPTKKTCNKLEKVLKVMNGKHMVIGHNIVDGIQSNCNGKLWSIDVGMSRSIDGKKIEVLEINNNKNVKILRG